MTDRFDLNAGSIKVIRIIVQAKSIEEILNIFGNSDVIAMHSVEVAWRVIISRVQYKLKNLMDDLVVTDPTTYIKIVVSVNDENFEITRASWINSDYKWTCSMMTPDNQDPTDTLQYFPLAVVVTKLVSILAKRTIDRQASDIKVRISEVPKES